MKKTVIIIICVIVGLIGLYIFGSGFMKESGAFIEDYTVSSDGSELTINLQGFRHFANAYIDNIIRGDMNMLLYVGNYK